MKVRARLFELAEDLLLRIPISAPNIKNDETGPVRGKRYTIRLNIPWIRLIKSGRLKALQVLGEQPSGNLVSHGKRIQSLHVRERT